MSSKAFKIEYRVFKVKCVFFLKVMATKITIKRRI
ncbi:hypothetical protein QEI_3220, partial [Clostridioides difficile CD129]